jgi:hypothetical protein
MNSHRSTRHLVIYVLAAVAILLAFRIAPQITANQLLARGPVLSAPEIHNLNGVGQDVALANSAGLKITAGLTLDAWINPASRPASDSLTAIATKWTGSAGGNSYGLWLENNGGVLRIVAMINPVSGAQETVIGGNIPVNAWTHVAMTYDPSSSRLMIYQNGSSVGATLGRPSAIRPTNTNVYIGSAHAGSGQFFSGSVASINIFDRALSNSEIASLAAAPSAAITATATPTPTPTPTPNLELNGQGTITGPHGNQASFTMSDIEMEKVTPKYFEGKLTYHDSAAGIDVTSQRITSVSIASDRMSATFSGMNNAQTISYTVWVTSNQHPTTGDAFTIQTNTGYTASGNLTSGAIGVSKSQ